MEQSIVHLQAGSIAKVKEIIELRPRTGLFVVLDSQAYMASGAAAVLDETFSQYATTRFSGFDINPKIQEVERGIEMLRECGADLIVAVGGGTALDLSKLIGVLAAQEGTARDVIAGDAKITCRGTETIVVPTTAGTGSEATHFAVVYMDESKHSVAHQYLLPEYAVIDPTLSYSLPPQQTAATGLDVLCHAVESLWSVGGTEASQQYAREAIQLAVEHLSTSVNCPTPESREGMSKAAHLSGKAINVSKTTAAHALSYFLGAEYNLPHGIAVALTLSPLLAYNAQVSEMDCADPRGPEQVRIRIKQIVELLGAENVASACRKIKQLLHELNCPLSLGEVGVDSAALQRLISGVNQERLSNNPRSMTDALLHEALVGEI